MDAENKTPLTGKQGYENPLAECYFVSDKKGTSATICANCGKEKMLHTIGEGLKASKVIMFGIQADIISKIQNK